MVSLRGKSIIIRTQADAQKLESAVEQMQMQYVPFLVYELTTLINQLIVDPIQTKMRARGISRKVIDRTYLDKMVYNKGQIIVFTLKSDYTAENGFPVAVMIEYGRRAFFVRPLLSQRGQFTKVKKEMGFKSSLPRSLHWIKDGVNYFSMGHKIPRKPGSYIIQDGIKSGQPKVQKELNKRTKQWINHILKS